MCKYTHYLNMTYNPINRWTKMDEKSVIVLFLRIKDIVNFAPRFKINNKHDSINYCNIDNGFKPIIFK